MDLDFKNILMPLTTSAWWRNAYEAYAHGINLNNDESVMVLYNADVDGFAASFFVYRYLLASNNILASQFQSRPIWNYEYDFQWVPQFIGQAKPDLVVCVDIPIIQEPNVLNAVQKECRIVIYDHHVVPPNVETPRDKTLFLNSRALSDSNEDHPASAFSAAAANQIGALSINDLPILATGLKGDWALKKYPEFAEQLEKLLPGFMGDPSDWNTPLSKFTAQLNALFRAHPGQQFQDLHNRLAYIFDTEPVNDAIATFVDEFQLKKAAADVQLEVDTYLKELEKMALSQTQGGIFIAVPKVKTFNVGILATILARRNIAPVVAIGYEAGERVQFELRIASDAKIDLTKVLREQRTSFQPLTSGGHPMAAGALVWKRDIQRFEDSIREALAHFMKQPNTPQ